jgi:hypothetical protein
MTPSDTNQRISDARQLESRLVNIENGLKGIQKSLDDFIHMVKDNYVTRVEFAEVDIRVKDYEKFKWIVMVAIVGSFVSFIISISKIVAQFT